MVSLKFHYEKTINTEVKQDSLYLVKNKVMYLTLCQWKLLILCQMEFKPIGYLSVEHVFLKFYLICWVIWFLCRFISDLICSRCQLIFLVYLNSLVPTSTSRTTTTKQK